MSFRSVIVIIALFLSPAVRAAVSTPTGGQVLAKIRKEHPRLLATNADFDRIRQGVGKNPEVAKWAEAIRKNADQLLAAEPSRYEIPDGKRLLETSRRVLDRSVTLGLTYKLGGDKRYADRLWQELDAAAKFQDWNPRHFLDTAEMTAAFAIAYDWLYDYWTKEQRTALKKAIVEKGLNQALPIYRKDNGWAAAEHNWNQVCNGGMTLGALAIAEEERTLAGEILSAAIKSIPRAMKHFAPDGGWVEGPSYWDYATKYNVFFLAALESATGTAFGLAEMEGFSRAGDFPLLTTGPIGRTFNYADAGDKGSGGPQLFWLATRYKEPAFAAWRIARIGAKPNALDLLWGAQWAESAPKLSSLPLAKYFRGIEVVTMRSAWDDPQATFVGFKGGDNQANHGHLDLGSFVLDSQGQRWAIDLGPDDYNLPDYFGPRRWEYYRCRAEGQNTLAINSGAGPDQDPKGKARIIRFNSQPGSASAIADLEAVYSPAVKNVQRGVRLDGQKVLVQDEVKSPRPVELWWFMHTEAEVSTNGSEATLTMGGKQLTARILQPPGARFEVMAAEPLPKSPHPPRQQVKGTASDRDSSNVRKLAIKLTGVTNTTVAVQFALSGDTTPAGAIVPLARWQGK